MFYKSKLKCINWIFVLRKHIYQSLKIQERETQGDVLHHTNHFLFYELLQTNENRFRRILFPNLPNHSLPNLIFSHRKSYLQQLWEWLLLVQQYSLSISSPKDSVVFPQSLSSLSLSHTEKQVVSFQSQNTAALTVFFNWNFAIFNIDNTISKNILVFALHNASTAHKNLKDSFKQTVTSITTSIFFIKNSLIFTFPAYSTAW